MNEQEIERCLERFTMGKTADVMNFDYAGTLAYIQRLKAENAELKTRLEKAAVPPCKIGDVLYTVTITFSDGWVGDTIIRRSAISPSETVVTEKNIWRMCELIRIGKAFFSKEEAEARLEELKGEKE